MRCEFGRGVLRHPPIAERFLALLFSVARGRRRPGGPSTSAASTATPPTSLVVLRATRWDALALARTAAVPGRLSTYATWGSTVIDVDGLSFPPTLQR